MAGDQIRQQTVVGQVMQKIRTLIASGAYAPGDRIPTEKELAERFGIGRSSIREAIKIFNYLGVLESRPALGTFVRERSNISAEALSWSLLLGHDELEELIDLRGSIELWSLLTLVASVQRRDPAALETVASLHGVVDRMEASAKEGRREELVEADFEFHYAIIKSSGNALFTSLYETLRSFLVGEIERSQDDYADPSQIWAEHRDLLSSFESANSTTAAGAYADHIANIKRRLRSQSGSGELD